MFVAHQRAKRRISRPGSDGGGSQERSQDGAAFLRQVGAIGKTRTAIMRRCEEEAVCSHAPQSWCGGDTRPATELITRAQDGRERQWIRAPAENRDLNKRKEEPRPPS